jgi:hypothetical protein
MEFLWRMLIREQGDSKDTLLKSLVDGGADASSMRRPYVCATPDPV